MLVLLYPKLKWDRHERDAPIHEGIHSTECETRVLTQNVPCLPGLGLPACQADVLTTTLFVTLNADIIDKNNRLDGGNVSVEGILF